MFIIDYFIIYLNFYAILFIFHIDLFLFIIIIILKISYLQFINFDGVMINLFIKDVKIWNDLACLHLNYHDFMFVMFEDYLVKVQYFNEEFDFDFALMELVNLYKLENLEYKVVVVSRKARLDCQFVYLLHCMKFVYSSQHYSFMIGD